MFLFILESLGSTELFFILIMALVFFGPRKLPQLSRTLGKNLAEFRRASEDFKRTWEREVALEDVPNSPAIKGATEPSDNSILNPLIAAPPEDQIVARSKANEINQAAATENSSTTDDYITEAPRKQDWL